jgi:hypothetical protein
VLISNYIILKLPQLSHFLLEAIMTPQFLSQFGIIKKSYAICRLEFIRNTALRGG